MRLWDLMCDSHHSLFPVAVEGKHSSTALKDMMTKFVGGGVGTIHTKEYQYKILKLGIWFGSGAKPIKFMGPLFYEHITAARNGQLEGLEGALNWLTYWHALYHTQRVK
ncbi:unnamed protein product [Ostreobium quekettii]|uniref:Uncharacterized protein n=1 Tax=Ostreobium quekettii TaxID=121088 RepID=A0A8S1IZ69_9CHLO|nr:unnamed protein product [Ostreobium quekettii]